MESHSVAMKISQLGIPQPTRAKKAGKPRPQRHPNGHQFPLDYYVKQDYNN